LVERFEIRLKLLPKMLLTCSQV